MSDEELQKLKTEFIEAADVIGRFAGVVRFAAWAIAGIVTAIISISVWVYATNASAAMNKADIQQLQSTRDITVREWSSWRIDQEKNTSHIMTLLDEHEKLLSRHQDAIDGLERYRPNKGNP